MALQPGRIEDLADQMRERAKPFVLVLGSRASINPTSPLIARIVEIILRNLSRRDPEKMSEEEQIAEFYAVLDRQNSSSERYSWLERLFTDAQPSAGYLCLARLIAAGFFNVVLSTNLDTLLEDGLQQVGLVPGKNFKTFNVYEVEDVLYSTAAIRGLVKEAFTVRDLRQFCQDHADFRPVLNGLGPNACLEDMASTLIEYCRTQMRFPELLAGIREFNPRQYKRHHVPLDDMSRQINNPAPKVKVLKLHGDLLSRLVKFTPAETSEFLGEITNLATDLLRNDVLLVGLSERDGDLVRCLPKEQGIIWYAGMHGPASDSDVGQVMEGHAGSYYIDGDAGEFETFFQELEQLVGRVPVFKPGGTLPPGDGLEGIKAVLERIESITAEILAEIRSLKSISGDETGSS